MSFEEDFEAFTGTGPGSWIEAATAALDEANKGKPAVSGLWGIHDPAMTPDCLLVAPDGCVIEQDGECPHGHKSPLIGVLA